MKKRFLSILLSLCMVLSAFPTIAFADEGAPEPSAFTCETEDAANTDCTVYGADALGDTFTDETTNVFSDETTNVFSDETTNIFSDGAADISSGDLTYNPDDASHIDITISGFELGQTPENCKITDIASTDGTSFSTDDVIAVKWYTDNFTNEMGSTDVFAADISYGCYIWLNANDLTSAPTVDVNGKTQQCSIDQTGTALLIECSFDSLTPDETIDLQNLLDGGGTVTLDKDYTITKRLNVAGTVTLDLNGHVIRMSGNDDTMINVYGQNTLLTLQDSNPNTEHTGLPDGGVLTGNNGYYGGCVYVNSNGSFTMNGGTIYNCSASDYGGGASVASGNFTMNGGTIYNCSAKYGGGISVNSNDSFTMNGGTIYNCSATVSGSGGLYVGSNDSCTMNGGIINDTVYIEKNGRIQTTNSSGCTEFYGEVTNYGTISGGIYYGGIQNKSTGSVTEPYYTVSFDLNNGSGSVPTQWFVNVSTASALQPTDPTRDNYQFTGWYNGDTKYDFNEAVTENITLTAKWVTSNVSTEDELKDALDEGFTSIKLIDDIQLTSTLDLGKKAITLDLNGHVIRMTGSGSVISVSNSLTLEDNSPDAEHNGENTSLPAGGVITGGNAIRGGGVYIDSSATFTMNGGSIYNCSATAYGGGVYTYSYSSFIMNGGSIQNCSAAGAGGGGVSISDNCTFTMNDGSIRNCTSLFGGGVYSTSENSTFIMNGGIIEDCTASEASRKSDSINNGNIMYANGGTVKGTVINPGAAIESTTPDGCTRFYDKVTNSGTISGGIFYGEVTNSDTISSGIFYGGIQNKNSGTVSEPYYTVSFELNGGSGSVPTQWFVNVSTEPALQPADAAKDGYTLAGWYNGDTRYNFTEAVTKSITLTAKWVTSNVSTEGEIKDALDEGITSIKLIDDILLTNTLDLGNKTITLDLNGHVLQMTGSGSVISVSQSLTLEDSSPDAEHNGENTSLPAGGVITGGNAIRGGGVYIDSSATFTMNGGSIYNCSATAYGGGVYTYSYSSFIMNGGSIQNCSAAGAGGGGVSISDNCTFTMNDGSIRNCTSLFGGGVYSTSENSTFIMNGGIIEDCTASEASRKSDSINNGNIMYANGGIVKGTVINPGGTIESTNSDGCTRFYDKVTNSGTISGGIYYSDIQNDSTGTVSEPYYTVSFELNGGSGSVPTQWFVNVSTETVLQPDDPTKEGSIFAGWYNGDTIYDFTESITESITLTAKWISGNVSSESELKDALNAGFTSIKLLGNIQLSGTLNLSDKIITLDLNGYTLKGNILMADTQAAPKSILTLIDSTPAKGGVLNGEIELTRGSYGTASYLYANGGTITGKVSLNSYIAHIYCTSSTPTVFKGFVGNNGEIHGGVFYNTTINKSCIKEKTITFKNGSSVYAYEVVAADNNTVEPLSPSVKTGYQSFDGWHDGETKYTFGSPLSEDITLTAKFTPITYDITCDLDEGSASNPTSFTVESEDITLNNPVKAGYTFTGWSGTGLTGENNMSVTIPKGSTGNRTYTAHFSQNSYKIVFDTAGGSDVSEKTDVKWTDKVLDDITAPEWDGWEFTGWKYGEKTVTADTTYAELATDDAIASITIAAQWKHINHSWEDIPAKKASLTEAGYSAHKECTDCHETEGKTEIPQIDESSIILDETSFIYDGEAKTPAVTIKDKAGNVLTKDTDYTLEYSNNVNAGTATVTITFEGSYSGSKDLTFTIAPKAAPTENVTLSATKYTYSGGVMTPDVKVLDENGNTMPADSYTVSYASGRKNAGQYKVTVTFKGNYSGSKDLYFTIVPKAVSTEKATLSTIKYTYSGGVMTPGVKVLDTNGNTISSGNYTVSYASGRKNVGRYKVTITFKGNYSGSKALYFTIVPKAPASAKATLTAKYSTTSGYDDVMFSWDKSTGASGYTVYYKKSSASGYTYLKRTTGTYVYKKDLSDGIKYNFKVVPYYKGTDGTIYASDTYKTASVYTLKKLSTPKVKTVKNVVKVAWTNINGESGYQISRSTSKTGTKIVSTYSTTSGTYKYVSATKNTTYYYKVRAFRKVDGKVVYGPWSNVTKYKR